MAKVAAKPKAAVKSKGRGNVRVGATGGGESLWDRPVLMNLLADLLLLAGGLLLAWAAAVSLQRLPVFPLRQLVVVGALDQVARGQIETTARSVLVGNFFTVNLDAAQAAFERMPWVRRAELRRRWPDGIELAIEEHSAVARWTPQDGESRLVNRQGEVFVASSRAAMPAFSGPEGSAARVLDRYREFAGALDAIGRKPVAVSLSPREAWQVRLDDGVVVEFGRDQPKAPLAERLDRFTGHYAAVRARLQTVGVVDMRYPNGFALKAHKS